MAKGRKTGGRQKGSKNKRGTLREAVWLAYEGMGGQAAFVRWAMANPSNFYERIFAKLIPLEIATDGDAPLPLRVELTDHAAPASDAE